MKEYSDEVIAKIKEVIDKYNAEVENGTATECLGDVISKIKDLTGDDFESDNTSDISEMKKKFDFEVPKYSKEDLDRMIAEIDEKIKRLEEKENQGAE